MGECIAATVSLDLDNYWAYLRAHGDNTWQDYPSFLDIAGPRILRFFEQRNIKPTIFVVGQDLLSNDNAKIVESMSKAGFEIGNHSFSHKPDFHSLSIIKQEDEIRSCEELIQEVVGDKPLGFRGPSFQISSQIAGLLIKLGYRYDASSYPTSIAPLARTYHLAKSKLTPEEKRAQKHLFGSFANAFSTLKQHTWTIDGQSIIEVPVTTMPITRLPIHFTYLNYIADKSERLAIAYFRTTMMLLGLTKVSASFLLHATDFLGADDHPIPTFVPGMKRTFYEKVTLLHKFFDGIEQNFSLSGIDHYHSRH